MCARTYLIRLWAANASLRDFKGIMPWLYLSWHLLCEYLGLIFSKLFPVSDVTLVPKLHFCLKSARLKFCSTLQLLLTLLPGNITPLYVDNISDGGSNTNACLKSIAWWISFILNCAGKFPDIVLLLSSGKCQYGSWKCCISFSKKVVY